MPELPEVETIVRDLRPLLEGRKLDRPRVLRPDVLRRVTAARLTRTLSGNPVRRVYRRAKHAVIELESGHCMVIQPRMTGSLLTYDRPLTADERRYAVFRAGLGGGHTLVYRDVRRLGTITLFGASEWARASGRMGPEPLDPAFTVETLRKSLAGSRQAIKKAIMDQNRLAGVGNIYANEALFRAGIDPSRAADRLSAGELARLHLEIRSILAAAVENRGTTFRDYRTGTGEKGGFQGLLVVYGRGGEPCVRCGTRLATTHEIDGRSTTFCWRCQPGR